MATTKRRRDGDGPPPSLPRSPPTPATWGPPLWDLLFTVVFRCSAAKLPLLAPAMEDLQPSLPCPHCRRSYAEFRARVPFPRPGDDAAEWRLKIAAWLWTCKDNVNRKLNKPFVPFKQVQAKYAAFRSLTSDWTLLDLADIMFEQATEGEARRRVARFVARMADAGAGPVFEPAIAERVARVVEATRDDAGLREAVASVATWLDLPARA